jgi:16S rRNA G1207 methylase RsmC
MSADVYFKKEIQLRHGGHTLRLRVSQDLFSSHEVDIGTQRLLRTLLDLAPAQGERVLDLGCGYGPLGLALRVQAPQRTVHMVDRDALAVEFARQNATLNGLTGVSCYGGLGYDDIAAADFDLIVINVPAKAGPPVIAHLLQDAAHRLRPGGLVAIVVVTPLEPLVADLLAQPEIDLRLRRAWPGHTVFHYGFSQVPARPAASALERGVYDCGEVSVSWPGRPFALRLAYGLADGESLGQGNEMLLAGLGRLPEREPVRRALVLNPVQGHAPVALWQRFQPAEVIVVDRDLLSLRCARANLVRNGCGEEQVVLHHQAGLARPGSEQADLIAALLREEEGPEAIAATIAQAAQQLAVGGTMLLAGSSTAVTRVERLLQSTRSLTVRRRTRSKGYSLLQLEHRAAVGISPPRER